MRELSHKAREGLIIPSCTLSGTILYAMTRMVEVTVTVAGVVAASVIAAVTATWPTLKLPLPYNVATTWRVVLSQVTAIGPPDVPLPAVSPAAPLLDCVADCTALVMLMFPTPDVPVDGPAQE